MPNPLILESNTGRSSLVGATSHAGAGSSGSAAQASGQPSMAVGAVAGIPGSAVPSLGSVPGAAGRGSDNSITSVNAALAAGSGAAGQSAAVGGSRAPAAGKGEPSAGAGARGPNAGSSGSPGTATACKMTVDYTSVGSHGMWYPHNIGAVWVEDTNGKFIKTIERWAGIRAPYLAAWNMRESQHGKWPSCPFANACTGQMVPDQVDVMTQATIFEDHHAHHAMWSCKDLNGMVVPDGKYRLFFEEMENIYPTFPAGPLAMVDFEKGPTATTLMPPDTMPFSGLKIVVEPGL